jgi:hypothetical protein
VPITNILKFRRPTAGPSPVDQDQVKNPAPIQQKNPWRTGLLLATSAALGGIAVAIWNRRTLAQFRQQTPPEE